MQTPYTSVLDFAVKHGLYLQGFNGILVMKSLTHWLAVFPDGETYWDGQLLTARHIPQIIDGRLYLPEEALRSAFEIDEPQFPKIAPPSAPLTGPDLLVYGSLAFPDHVKRRDAYTAYPINRRYDGHIFHSDGPLRTPPYETLDLRPKTIMGVCQGELRDITPGITFGRADMLIFRNKVWAIFGVFKTKDQADKPIKADYICMMRVKGNHFQMKLAANLRQDASQEQISPQGTP